MVTWLIVFMIGSVTKMVAIRTWSLDLMVFMTHGWLSEVCRALAPLPNHLAIYQIGLARGLTPEIK